MSPKSVLRAECCFNLVILELFSGSSLTILGHMEWTRKHPVFVHSIKSCLNTVTGLPTYVCPNCGRSYKYKDNMTRHLRYECGKEPRFQCVHCPYKAKQRTHLNNHIASKHRDIAITTL